MSTVDVGVLAPTLFVTGGAVVILFLTVGLSGGSGSDDPRMSESRLGILLAVVATASLGLCLWVLAADFAEGVPRTFQVAPPMLGLDRYSALACGVIGIAALGTVWLSMTYLQALHINHGEYYALLLLSTAGMFVMVSALDLLTAFLGIELASVPLYALAGFDRRKLRSNEAALKYFVTGAFASAIALYGIALLYGVTGHTDFGGVRAGFDAQNPVATAGVALVLVGFGFKLSAPPFHQWTPDVYQGAPAPVAAFVSVAVKAAAFLLLLRFLELALADFTGVLQQVFWVLALLAIGIGNLMAFIQTNVKRLLAYSTVAHVGYLLIALASGTEDAYSASFFYLYVYVFMNLGAFAVVVVLAHGGHESDGLEDYAGLASRRPGLAAATALFMFSLAGLPGTAGFAAKLELFSAAIDANQVELVIVGVLASAISLFYYLRVPVAMYMRESGEQASSEIASSEFLVLALCAVAVLYYGFSFDLTLFDEAIRALR